MPFGWSENAPTVKAARDGNEHLQLAQESLRDLLDDPRVPAEVRDSLAGDYAQVQVMLDKLEQGHIHIAAVGRVSVGESATLNALLGEDRFSTSPLHGKTSGQFGHWQEYQSGGVFLIDTPGLTRWTVNPGSAWPTRWRPVRTWCYSWWMGI